MGIAYERSVGFYKDAHTHDRPMLVMPRGSCVVKVRTGGSRSSYEIDQASVLIVPRGLAHEDEGVTRSEEHTSELQSRFDLVCRLLLEKKKAMISALSS